MYEFKQPVGGKLVEWHPLLVADEMDAAGAFRNQPRLLEYEVTRRRILKVDGQACEVGAFRTWDRLDLRALSLAIERQEALLRTGYMTDVAAPTEEGGGRYRWELPHAKVPIVWRHGTVGDDIDALSTYSRPENQHLQEWESVRVRFVLFDEKPGLMMPDLRRLQAIEFDVLTDHMSAIDKKREEAFQCGPLVV